MIPRVIPTGMTIEQLAAWPKGKRISDPVEQCLLLKNGKYALLGLTSCPDEVFLLAPCAGMVAGIHRIDDLLKALPT